MNPFVAEREALLERITSLLHQASQKGIAAQINAHQSQGLTVQVRQQTIETVTFRKDCSLQLTVYQGFQKASVSTTDLSPPSLQMILEKAIQIARQSETDPANGLPEMERLTQHVSNEALALHHPSHTDPDLAIQKALDIEKAALSFSPWIQGSEGAHLSTTETWQVLANTAGTLGTSQETLFDTSCVMLAAKPGSPEKQRDYEYSISRTMAGLCPEAELGRAAAEKAVARLGARRLKTRVAPVIFNAPVAASLVKPVLAALSGSNLYRKTSFLLDSLGQPLFPDWMQWEECPHEIEGLASTYFDGEGVATLPQSTLIQNGVVARYVLDTYSGRRLERPTTANSGGVHNLRVIPKSPDCTLQQLLAAMGEGLFVTELMGQGVNLMTGDYSRGAVGFWIEGGQIAYPVEGITVAGHLPELYRSLVATGSDIDRRSSIQTGSWFFPSLTIAGE